MYSYIYIYILHNMLIASTVIVSIKYWNLNFLYSLFLYINTSIINVYISNIMYHLIGRIWWQQDRGIVYRTGLKAIQVEPSPRVSFSSIGRGTNLSYTSSIYQFDKSQTNCRRPISYDQFTVPRIESCVFMVLFPRLVGKKYMIEQLDTTKWILKVTTVWQGHRHIAMYRLQYELLFHQYDQWGRRLLVNYIFWI